MLNEVILLLFIAGYICITIEHKININKSASAILTAVICWTILAFGQPSATGHGDIALRLGHHMEGIAQIVFFLMGAMTIVQLMEQHGCFQNVANLLKTSNKAVLLWIVSFLTFFLSAVLDNLTTSIVMVSLLQKLVNDKEDRMVFAGMIIIAANAGGAWTPIGDVTTTMLWIGGRISSLGIMQALFIPSLISMVIPILFLSPLLKKGEVNASVGLESFSPVVGSRRVFAFGLGALIFVPIFKSLTGLPPFMGILLGLGILWLVTDAAHTDERGHYKVPHMLSKIDLSSILFFLGILLAVAALETGGILSQLSSWMDSYLSNKDLVATFLGLLSAIVDNVPLTAATMGMYPVSQYPMDAKLWELLAFAVGTGGSILIIGSAAGVVVMGMENINFLWYLRRISFPALLGYFAGIASYLFIYKICT